MSVVYFILFLGFLIFFHEFGHYLMARLVGVKVLVFSFGFGQRLFGIKIGDTDYRVSLWPLGGYVKLYGDDPTEEVPENERHRAFLTAPIWKRSLIAFGGPLFSLLLPYLAFMGTYAFNTRAISSRLGSVLEGGPAWNAGLRPGDRVTRIESDTINYWWQLKKDIETRPDQKVFVSYKRSSSTYNTWIKTRSIEDPIYSMLGINKRRGMIDVSPLIFRPTLYVLPGGLADFWGLQTGDAVISVNNTEVYSFDGLKAFLSKCLNTSKGCKLKIVPEGWDKMHELTVWLYPIPGMDPGIWEGGRVVRSVKPDSPAYRLGIRPQDMILKVDGTHIYNYSLFFASLIAAGSRYHTVTFIHQGKEIIKRFSLLNPEWKPGSNKPKYLDFGITVYEFIEPGERIPIINRWNYVWSNSVRRGNRALFVSAAALWGLVTGRVSVKEMGGPIMIYDVASKAGRSGWTTFFAALAWISASIGLLNLLPIPVLDGGHLLLFAIEAIKRKPLSLKARTIATYIGMSILLSLFVLVLFNDIMRKLGMM